MGMGTRARGLIGGVAVLALTLFVAGCGPSGPELVGQPIERIEARGKQPMAAGLWWLVLPLLAMAFWLYFTDGRMRRPRRARPAKVATP